MLELALDQHWISIGSALDQHWISIGSALDQHSSKFMHLSILCEVHKNDYTQKSHEIVALSFITTAVGSCSYVVAVMTADCNISA